MRSAKNSKTTQSFLEEWPILTEPIGSRLMEIDFDVWRTRQLNTTTFSDFVNDMCAIRSSRIKGTARDHIDIINDKNKSDDIIVAR